MTMMAVTVELVVQRVVQRVAQQVVEQLLVKIVSLTGLHMAQSAAIQHGMSLALIVQL